MRRAQKFLISSLTGILLALLIFTGCTRTISTALIEQKPTAVPAARTTTGASPYPVPPKSNLPVSTPSSSAAQPSPETPSLVSTATSKAAENNEPTLVPFHTPLPTLGPDGLAELLESAFSIQELPGTNRHSLLKITGWDYGFRSSHYCEYGPYRWLDDTHLLLFTNIGEEEGMGINEWTWPVVVNLDGRTWLPPVDGRTDYCRSVEWSQALQSLISSQDGDLLVSDLDGKLLKRIAGKGESRILISPSGEIILTANTWIDLASGKEVEFNWDANITGPFYPAWTQDEKRIFNCCYAYLDASTGEASWFQLGGLMQSGRGLSPGFDGIESRWVLSDTHSMTLWDFYIDSEQSGIVPLFVPEAQAYVDVRDLVGIPPEQPCVLNSISADGNLIWIQCIDQDDYLIDLRTYEKTGFIGKQLFGWSADNRFALIGEITDSDKYLGNFELFSIPNGQHFALSDPSIHVPVWSLQDHRLAYLSADGKNLVYVDAESQESQSSHLPIPFNQVLWNPTGKYLALVAQDGSLWQGNTTGTATSEQISPPLPDVRDVRWSPDGMKLSFISATDLYIVK